VKIAAHTGFLGMKYSYTNSKRVKTLSYPACFEDFAPKQPDRMWLCASATLSLKVVESCSKAEKTQQVFWFAMKIHFWLGLIFFLSDVISGGLLGHLGPLHLALGPNH